MNLSPVEKHILVYLLLHGDDRPANIGDTEDSEKPHPASVSRSMANLKEKDLVRLKGNAVYTLTLQGQTAARSIRNEDNCS